MSIRFSWNRKKAEDNLRKHHISFEEASTVFGDPLSITVDDPAHSGDESRFILLGHSISGRLLVIVHSEREGSIRIISAREATRRERRTYEQE